MKKMAGKLGKVIVTLGILAVAGLLIWRFYDKHFSQPWTRDAHVRAQVVQVAARVSAPVVKLQVVDNQFVKAGDVLFELDTSTYAAAVEQAAAQLELAKNGYETLDSQVTSAKAGVTVAEASVNQAESGIKQADATIAKNKAELARQHNLLPQNATSKRAVQSAEANYDVSTEQRKAALGSLAQAQASLAQAQANVVAAIANRGAEGDKNASLRSARAALETAQLNLDFCQVKAPVDGYVTNLKLRTGSQAVANQPILALVDTNSFWVQGYFKETQISGVKSGDKARVKLMGYQDQPFDAVVDSIGWGIAMQDGSTGVDLLPNVSPTFDWIRLAQRIPVKIVVEELPEGVELRVGATASVEIHTENE